MASDPNPTAPLPPAPYWVQSRQPWASLCFVAPLLVIYEAGIILMGPEAMRNGAEVWLRMFLNAIGLGQYFLLPILTVGILSGWHYTTRHRWRLPAGLLTGMLVESLVLAWCLRLIPQLPGLLLPGKSLAQVAWLTPVGGATFQSVRTAVGYLGAGIYEELLFRLMLLPATVCALRALGSPPRLALVAGVVLTSLVFSLAHYVGASGETIRWFSFVFRFLAGAFFATLFVYRGFGIAVGAHAGYDLLIGLFY